MNIKDPLNPYVDDRKEKVAKNRETLREKKLVYKCNYELVMGHIPHKASMSIAATRPRQMARTSDATLNGSTIR